MILIAAVDDRDGMMFNKRRQSQDQILRQRILEMTDHSRLWMNHYTGKQFMANDGVCPKQIQVDDDFMHKAAPGEYCFVEDVSAASYEKKIEQIILFKWNRKYPGDFFFDIDLKKDGWKLAVSEDFPGSSHEKITKEVYLR